MRRTRSRSARAAASRRRTTSTRCGRCSPAPSGRSRSSAAAAGRRRRAEDIRAFAEANELPVGAAFRRQDCDRQRLAASTPATSASASTRSSRARRATPTCCSSSAPRLGEMTTTRLHARRARPQQTLVHVHADAEELGRVYQAGAADRLRLGAVRGGGARRSRLSSSRWRGWTRAGARRLSRRACGSRPSPATLDMGEVMAYLRERLPRTRSSRTAPATSRSGRTASTRSARYRTQLAPTSGAMGYGVPAAVAAKMLHPERIVVCFAGDGDFLMSGPGARDRGAVRAAVVVLVVNNGMYGTIRMHQERQFPGRVVGTDLVNPDFAALRAGVRRARRGGRAHGRVRRPRSSGRSRAGRPALLELRDRSRGDHAAHDADRDPCRCAARLVTDAWNALITEVEPQAARPGPLHGTATARQGPDRHRRGPHDIRLEDLRRPRACADGVGCGAPCRRRRRRSSGRRTCTSSRGA